MIHIGRALAWQTFSIRTQHSRMSSALVAKGLGGFDFFSDAGR